VALALVVLGSAWYFVRDDKPTVVPRPATEPSTPAVSGDSIKPASGSASSAKTPAAKAAAEEAAKKAALLKQYQANHANRSCFWAFLRFMTWAYTEGQNLKGDQLTSGIRAAVSLDGVDDPDVREVNSLILESFRIANEHPLQSSSEEDFVVTGADGRSTLTNNQAAQAWRKINVRVKSLCRDLKQRYGEPPALATPPLAPAAPIVPPPAHMDEPKPPQTLKPDVTPRVP
jgi:hypothetical protein